MWQNRQTFELNLVHYLRFESTQPSAVTSQRLKLVLLSGWEGHQLAIVG